MKKYKNESELDFGNLSYKFLAKANFENIVSRNSLSESEIKLIASETDSQDLYVFSCILVSSGWNLNDQVFTVEELFKARKTPIHKQINKNHSTEVIGHIVDCCIVDENHNIVNEKDKDGEEIDSEELPEKLHLYCKCVIYKTWNDENKEKEIEKLVAEIKDGKWAVSMEARPSNFNYVIKDGDKEVIVARTKNTSNLSKHLKQFGGSGEYDGKKIGLLAIGVRFIGQGMTQYPANPESIIIKADKNTVYKEIVNRGSNMDELKIKEDNQRLVSEIENVNKLLELKSNELAEKTEKINALSETIKSLEASLSEANLKLTVASRTTKALEKLNKVDSETLVNNTIELTEKNFDAILAMQSKKETITSDQIKSVPVVPVAVLNAEPEKLDETKETRKILASIFKGDKK